MPSDSVCNSGHYFLPCVGTNFNHCPVLWLVLQQVREEGRKEGAVSSFVGARMSVP